ncbi:MAG: hypothetical protein M5U09_19895 [Gammaproteobacteria bacterium]|nr:hypothetical protein [Gammaproteobacteria bacterium]
MSGLSGNWVQTGDTFLTIPEGESSIGYQIYLPADPSASWRIWYYCQSGCAANVYYAIGGVVQDFSDATPLPATSDHTNIDVTLPGSRVISGEVLLPPGHVAPTGGIEIDVGTNGSPGGGSDWVEIPEGESSASFAFHVVDDSAVSWRIRYFCLSGCDSYRTDTSVSRAPRFSNGRGFFSKVVLTIPVST